MGEKSRTKTGVSRQVSSRSHRGRTVGTTRTLAVSHCRYQKRQPINHAPGHRRGPCPTGHRICAASCRKLNAFACDRPFGQRSKKPQWHLFRMSAKGSAKAFEPGSRSGGND
jgi:hypothetical protein